MLVEAHRRVGADLRRTLEAGGAPAGRDDPCGTEELRRLHGDEADRARGAEHQDVLAAAERGTPGERQPSRQAGDPSPAASAGSAPSGTSTACASPSGARSAIAPCAVRPSEPPKIQTALPSAVRPTASQPGT